jgi:hypothetical protein
MALRRIELEDLLNRPGTYFNPQTEVMIVVDDSPVVDNEIFEDADDVEGDEWVVISDETPIDEDARDDLIEQFHSRHSPTTTSGVPADEDDDEDEDDELEPDEDEDDGDDLLELDPDDL